MNFGEEISGEKEGFYNLYSSSREMIVRLNLFTMYLISDSMDEIVIWIRGIVTTTK